MAEQNIFLQIPDYPFQEKDGGRIFENRKNTKFLERVGDGKYIRDKK